MGKEEATVVCGTDLGQSGQEAARLARAFASRLHAKLRLVHAVDFPDLDDLDGLDPSVRPAAEVLRRRLLARREEAEARLRALVDALTNGVEVSGSIVTGRPWEVLLASAEQEEAAAIVVGPHADAQGLLAKVGERLLGTTAHRVVRHADRLVLVGTGHTESAEAALGSKGPLTLVVGVDFEAGGAAALATARRLGGDSARLVLVHVLQDPFAPGDEPSDWPQLRSQWLVQLRERLAREASDAGELRVEPGDPADALARVGKEVGAHLVVVGAHAGGPLSRILLGSTAERCLRESPVPVLVVPPSASTQA